MATTHEQVVKVWIEPGCIVCDACETDCPEVFEVTEETCLIRPEAKSADFTKPLTPSIQTAAEGCPVDVIKFDTVEVEGEAPWAGQEEEAAAAGAPSGGGGGGGAKKGGWEPPEGPPDPAWAGLLETSHTSGSRSSGGPAVRVRSTTLPAKAPIEAVTAAVPDDAPPDALSATMVGVGLARPSASTAESIKAKGEEKARKTGVGSRIRIWLLLGWGGLLFCGATVGAALQAFIVPKVTKEPPSIFKAGKLADFPDVAVYEQFKGSQQVWIVRQSDDKLVALSTICTHLGCIPNWWPGDAKFKCPCHGSGFYMNGINFEGPAPRPLERHRIYLDGDTVMVDKAYLYREEKGQWDDANSYVMV